MLIITRKIGETLVIGDEIEVTLVQIQLSQNQVRLGITAPRTCGVFRRELLQSIKRENKLAASVPSADVLPSQLPPLRKVTEE